MSILLPARFLSAAATAIAAMSALQSMKGNVVAGIPKLYTMAQYSAASFEASIALTAILLAAIVNFVGIVTGATLFSPRLNLYYVIAHCAAASWLTGTLLQETHFKVWWYIVAMISVPTLLFESGMQVAVRYSKILV
ncbi:transmembrane protein [Blastocladiella britannica]|nr:transmembrane protein [Blastocladiella britannica]